ncbi:MAG: class D sortase [Acutalibacteraceae bacterium]|nr:class D sortase [Acutalibacteraceae bacterium]
MIFSKTEKDYSSEYKSIFVPIPEETPSETKDTNEYIDIDDIQYPKYGEHFAELIIDDCGVSTKLFMGDGDISLRNGAGTYYGSFIPGYGGTILVAGHNSTVFNGLKNAQVGQLVKIKTSYGNYTYEITNTAVKRNNDRTAFDLSADEENLIMYTCYPFDELGLTNQRYFVYAKFVSGPIITDNGKEVM